MLDLAALRPSRRSLRIRTRAGRRRGPAGLKSGRPGDWERVRIREVPRPTIDSRCAALGTVLSSRAAFVCAVASLRGALRALETVQKVLTRGYRQDMGRPGNQADLTAYAGPLWVGSSIMERLRRALLDHTVLSTADVRKLTSRARATTLHARIATFSRLPRPRPSQNGCRISLSNASRS